MKSGGRLIRNTCKTYMPTKGNTAPRRPLLQSLLELRRIAYLIRVAGKVYYGNV
jgi:hypothetical protein